MRYAVSWWQVVLVFLGGVLLGGLGLVAWLMWYFRDVMK
jgi:hypothetical protein